MLHSSLYPPQKQKKKDAEKQRAEEKEQKNSSLAYSRVGKAVVQVRAIGGKGALAAQEPREEYPKKIPKRLLLQSSKSRRATQNVRSVVKTRDFPVA